MRISLSLLAICAVLIARAQGPLEALLLIPLGAISPIEIADTFTGANGTALASHATTSGSYAWVQVQDAFTIQGNVVTNSASSVGTTLYYVNHTLSSTNCTASVDFNDLSSGGNVEVSIGARYDGAISVSANAYYVTVFPDLLLIRLYKVVAGTSTQLGSDALYISSVTNIAIKCSGTTISGQTNGVQFESVTDTAIMGAGFVGIGSGFRGQRPNFAVNYDNLSVSVP